TSQKIVRMVRSAGAREVHLRVSSPPTIGPCYYGIDTPQKEQLIAASHSIEEIERFLGADSLAYLSLSSLMASVQNAKDEFCSACFSGDYPVPLFDESLGQRRLFENSQDD
ncbi:MAG TPA: amidophosphoribosyltransferase, partial [Rhodothermia bacterium]|nr:amidophosphoribosyltransferase [Rhodothermia bacterium]